MFIKFTFYRYTCTFYIDSILCNYLIAVKNSDCLWSLCVSVEPTRLKNNALPLTGKSMQMFRILTSPARYVCKPVYYSAEKLIKLPTA